VPRDRSSWLGQSLEHSAEPPSSSWDPAATIITCSVEQNVYLESMLLDHFESCLEWGIAALARGRSCQLLDGHFLPVTPTTEHQRNVL
jgi:hypothetical protein